MSFDLTNKNISDTYQNLLQKTGSNNQLFDLLGNPVTDLTIQGALIAESYIVSQSTIVFSSGSTAFGNSSDDTHNFIGSLNTTSHITASGNISSSGTIIGSSLTITDDLSLRHITASGNISASGNLSSTGNLDIDGTSNFANTATFGGKITVAGNIEANGNIVGDNSTDISGINDLTLLGDFDGRGNHTFGNAVTDTHTFTGDITASGNISASENIILGTTKKLTFDNNLSGAYIDSPGSNQIDISINNSAKLKVLNSHIKLTEQLIAESSITASGGISSSGTLISNEINTIGHITASGDISASGTITMLTASIGGGIFTSASLASGGVSSYDDLTDVPTNIISSSAQLPSGIFSSSLQTFTNITASGNISASGTIVSTGTISNIGSLYQAQLDNGTTAGPRFNLGSKADPDSFLSIQASGGINKIDTKTRDFHLFSTAATTGLYFDEDNANIGIQTTTPTVALQVTGDISASGTIFASKLEVTEITSSIVSSSTNILIENITSSGDSIFGDTVADTHTFNGGIIAGNITASGNISASGGGTHIFGGPIRLINPADNTATQRIEFGNDTQRIEGKDDFLVFESDNQAVIKSDVKVNIDSPIMGVGAFTTGDTAGAVLHVSGVNATNETLIVEGSDGTDYLTVGLGGHITASGNISASGNIISSQITSSGFNLVGSGDAELEVDGHITASGNISSSGNLIGVTGSLKHIVVNDGSGVGKIQDGGGELHLVSDDLQFIGDSVKFVSQGTEVISIDPTSNPIDFSLTKNIAFNKGVSFTDITSSGNSIFGNAIGDTHKFNGHITASGNISSSGTIVTNKLQIDVNSSVGTPSIFPKGDTDTGIVFPSANTVSIQAAGTTPELVISQNKAVVQGQAAGLATLEVDGKITSSGFISTLSSITASGNISASGTIRAGGNINTDGNFVTDGFLTFGASGIRIQENPTGTIDVGAGQKIKLNGHTEVGGQITASGNISSSGTANTFGGTSTFGGNLFMPGVIKHVGATNNSIGFSDTNVITLNTDDRIDFTAGSIILRITSDGANFNSGFLNVNNSITASGNISASGTIFGTDIKSDGTSVVKSVTQIADSVAQQGKITFVDTAGFSTTKNISNLGSSDSPTFNNITASGHISGGGATNDLHMKRVFALDRIVTPEISEFTTNGGVSFNGNITASDNISASGTIFANDLQLTGSGNLYGSSSYLNIVNDGTAPSELRLNCEENTHYIGIRGPVHSGASSYVLKLPNGTPSDNQILKVNGSPSNGEVTLAWESDGGGGGGSVSGDTFATDLRIGRDSDNHVDFTTDNQIDFDIDGETSVIIKKTSDSGSIAVSGSIKVQPQELVPAISESRLYNKTSANGNVVDDLHFGVDGLTPAFAWVTLDDDGTATSTETIFGVGSAITSTTRNMTVVHDTTTNGTRIHAEMDGIYKVTGNFIFTHSTFNTMTVDINVDGSTVHTTQTFVHSAVDPVERTQIYVGSINSGSYVTATVDAIGTTNFEVGSVLLVERLS